MPNDGIEWKTVEVGYRSVDDGFAVIFRLPSGFKGQQIEVYEDAWEDLSVRHIPKVD